VLLRDDATGRRSGRIVEVEAYGGPEDAASHARFGPTARNAVMFGPAGVAYVYLVYGMYDCLNVVTGSADQASAVLIRAVEPIEGVALMRADRWERAVARRRRLLDTDALVAARDRAARVADDRLASGPGAVGAAFGLDRGWTGTDLLDPAGPLRIEAPEDPPDPRTIVAGPRVGVDYAGSTWAGRPWRFHLAGHRSVSRPRG
jgi:DNA-3-methyladenine glycosylase